MGLAAFITTVGQALISECVGGQMVFTKAELGSGGQNDSTYCRARTALASYEVDADIARVTASNGAAKVGVQYQNAEQASELVVREIGIYAKKAGAADNAAVLVCYANFGNPASPSDPDPADVIQPATAAQFARLYEIVIAITGVATVTVSVPSGAYQEAITASGLLVGDGNGNITALSTTYYAVASHTHTLNDLNGTLSIAKGGTNATSASQALTNLGIVYSATEPTYKAGGIWLQPVS